MRQGNDVLSWTSDALSINPCVLTGGSNNTRGCAESRRPAAITSPYCVTQWDGSSGWVLKMRLRPQVRSQIHNINLWTPRDAFPFTSRCIKLWQMDFFSDCCQRKYNNFNISHSHRHCITATKTVQSCIWLNCEGGRSIITLLPPPSWSVVMTKGCAGTERRTKALSSWLPTETGSNTA